ncbi:MAG TPA: hypothetical protein PLO51_03530 [Candidatus Micrarchaeota archaeon]|nr:hypothetical protein [Candidatus Micrarchaeota archaeon]
MSAPKTVKKIEGKNITGLTSYIYTFETGVEQLEVRESMTKRRNIVAKMGIQLEGIRKDS